MKRTQFLVASAIALVTSLILALPFTQRLESLSIDSLFWLRHQFQQALPSLHAEEPASNVVILAIDEETYQQPGFKDTPRVMWTPQYAQTLDAIIDGGAKVVGFDIVLPTSLETKLPGYDKPFLKTLFRHGRPGKIVLGKVQHHGKPLSPYRGHSFAVGDEKNIRLLNLGTSKGGNDGIIRNLPLWFDQGSRHDPSMSVELAARAIGEQPVYEKDKPLVLGGYEVPEKDGTMLINFNTHPNYVPAYSLADLHACTESGNTEYFKKHFEGKVVILGAILGLEDRKRASARYTNTVEGETVPERCVIQYDAKRYKSSAVRDDIPGVFIHANAINNLLNGNALRQIDNTSYALLALPLALVVALFTILLPPKRMGIATVVAVLAWTGIVLVAFYDGLVLPLLDPLVAAALAFSATLAYRFIVADKDKRKIKNAFGLYLEPAVIDHMMEEGDSPELGGEIRELTVWFSDIANYTSISESLSPADLVEFLNKYFDEMTSIVKEHGGFVDKFVGDAIIAVFGAPQHDPDHALHAVQSAMACDKRLKEIGHTFELPNDMPVAARIGVNTGEMLVGNIGSSNRLNYTVMGDAVNLAARLEGVNKMYGTTVMASDTTIAQCGDAIPVREIDTVRVKGKEIPVTIFEPLHPEMAANTELRNSFAEALAAFRGRDFTKASSIFRKLGIEGDLASSKFSTRATIYCDSPPPEDWDGVNTLDSK